MSKRQGTRKRHGKVRCIADPDFDRLSVGDRTWICAYPGCPSRAWSDGTPRFQSEEHFTPEGSCIHRKQC
jgi:hypothetical protein